jgi:hypothetical protein
MKEWMMIEKNVNLLERNGQNRPPDLFFGSNQRAINTYKDTVSYF